MCLGISPESPIPSSPPYHGSETKAVLAPANQRLTRQMSMSKAPRDTMWERRRWQQVLREERWMKSSNNTGDSGSESDITDDDLSELKGCIELGFGFKEEEGQALCNTLPALGLYFAVNRHLSPSPRSTLQGQSPCSPSPSSPPSPSSSTTSEPETGKIFFSPGIDANHLHISFEHRMWNIEFRIGGQNSSLSFRHLSFSVGYRNPMPCLVSLMTCFAGEDPELVKIKLRHWAQAVACSLMQSF